MSATYADAFRTAANSLLLCLSDCDPELLHGVLDSCDGLRSKMTSLLKDDKQQAAPPEVQSNFPVQLLLGLSPSIGPAADPFINSMEQPPRSSKLAAAAEGLRQRLSDDGKQVETERATNAQLQIEIARLKGEVERLNNELATARYSFAKPSPLMAPAAVTATDFLPMPGVLPGGLPGGQPFVMPGNVDPSGLSYAGIRAAPVVPTTTTAGGGSKKRKNTTDVENPERIIDQGYLMTVMHQKASSHDNGTVHLANDLFHREFKDKGYSYGDVKAACTVLEKEGRIERVPNTSGFHQKYRVVGMQPAGEGATNLLLDVCTVAQGQQSGLNGTGPLDHGISATYASIQSKVNASPILSASQPPALPSTIMPMMPIGISPGLGPSHIAASPMFPSLQSPGLQAQTGLMNMPTTAKLGGVLGVSLGVPSVCAGIGALSASLFTPSLIPLASGFPPAHPNLALGSLVGNTTLGGQGIPIASVSKNTFGTLMSSVAPSAKMSINASPAIADGMIFDVVPNAVLPSLAGHLPGHSNLVVADHINSTPLALPPPANSIVSVGHQMNIGTNDGSKNTTGRTLLGLGP